MTSQGLSFSLRAGVLRLTRRMKLLSLLRRPGAQVRAISSPSLRNRLLRLASLSLLSCLVLRRMCRSSWGGWWAWGWVWVWAWVGLGRSWWMVPRGMKVSRSLFTTRLFLISWSWGWAALSRTLKWRLWANPRMISPCEPLFFRLKIPFFQFLRCASPTSGGCEYFLPALLSDLPLRFPAGLSPSLLSRSEKAASSASCGDSIFSSGFEQCFLPYRWCRMVKQFCSVGASGWAGCGWAGWGCAGGSYRCLRRDWRMLSQLQLRMELGDSSFGLLLGSGLQLGLVLVPPLLLLGRLIGELSGDQFGRLILAQPPEGAGGRGERAVEVEGGCEGLELGLDLDLAATPAAGTESPCVLGGVFEHLEPGGVVELGVVVVGLVQEHARVGVDLVAVVHPQPRREDRRQQFAVVGRPLAVRGRVRLAAADPLLRLQVPDVHFAAEVAEAAQADQAVEVAPDDLVLVLLAELQDHLVLAVVEDGLGRHEPADHQVELPGLVPREVVQGPRGSLDLGDLVELVVVDVEPVLAVVGLAGGVVVGLQLDEELVGGGAELDLDLLRLVDGLLVVRLLLVGREQQQVALVALLVQEHSRHQVVLLAAPPRDLEELQQSRLQGPHHLAFFIIDFHRFRVIAEEEGIVSRELDQRVAVLDVVVGVGGLAQDGHLLQAAEVVEGGLALVGVDLVQHLEVLLAGGEAHRVDVVAVLLQEHSPLGQGVNHELGLAARHDHTPVPRLQQIRSHTEDLLGLLQPLHVRRSDEQSLLGTQEYSRGSFVIRNGILPAFGRVSSLHQ